MSEVGYAVDPSAVDIPPEKRPGDWTCKECGNTNFGWRNECHTQSCRAPKPADASNESHRDRDRDRDDRGSSRYDRSRRGRPDRRQEKRDGDWTCSNCGNMNFSWRLACNSKNCDVIKYGNEQYRVA